MYIDMSMKASLAEEKEGQTSGHRLQDKKMPVHDNQFKMRFLERMVRFMSTSKEDVDMKPNEQRF